MSSVTIGRADDQIPAHRDVFKTGQQAVVVCDSLVERRERQCADTTGTVPVRWPAV